MDSSGHVLAVSSSCCSDEVEHLECCLLVGEIASVANSPTEPGVQRLDGVCGVDDLPQLDGELKEWYELLPGITQRRPSITPKTQEPDRPPLGIPRRPTAVAVTTTPPPSIPATNEVDDERFGFWLKYGDC